MDKAKESNIKYACSAFLAVVVFVITYKYVLVRVNTDEINDLREHMWTARDIYLDRFWDIWLQRPYLFWHLCVKGLIKFMKFPVTEAAACVSAFFAAACYYVVFFMTERFVSRKAGRGTGMLSAGIACCLSFVMPFYIYWFNSYHYEGQYTINPIFNPTHMAVKPIGLLAFMFAVDLIRRYLGKECIFCRGKWTQKYLFVIFGGMLLLSTFTKPTFMYMLLPAGLIYLLLDLCISLWKKDGTWKKVWAFLWRIAVACIPSVIYLFIEYAAFYFWGGTNEDAKVVISPFLHVWHQFTSDVPKSILMAMAFPFWMVVTNFKYFVKSVEGRLSLIGYAVGTLEFAFFMETGFKMTHCNFSWPMMSGMLLLWVVAGGKLAELTLGEKNRKNALIVTGGWLFLLLHLFSGLYYINPYQYII